MLNQCHNEAHGKSLLYVHTHTNTQTHTHTRNNWIPEKGMRRGAGFLRGPGQKKPFRFKAMYHSGKGVKTCPRGWAQRCEGQIRWARDRGWNKQLNIGDARTQNLWLESGLGPIGYRVDSRKRQLVLSSRKVILEKGQGGMHTEEQPGQTAILQKHRQQHNSRHSDGPKQNLK